MVVGVECDAAGVVRVGLMVACLAAAAGAGLVERSSGTSHPSAAYAVEVDGTAAITWDFGNPNEGRVSVPRASCVVRTVHGEGPRSIWP